MVSGMVAGTPHFGGATWAVLQYVLGLRALGHEVYVVEPIQRSAIQPAGAGLSASVNAQYFYDVLSSFGLEGRGALLQQESHETFGLSYDALLCEAAGCDVLINISGMLTDPQLLEPIPRRVYLDLDPAFNQLWHSVEGLDVRFEGHTHFVTVGLALGLPECAIPTCGRRWQHTLQPIDLGEWPMATVETTGVWTTVGTWRGYGSVVHGGVLHGQRAHSFRRFFDLSGRAPAPIQAALAIHADEVLDLTALAAHQWNLVDPASVAATPSTYRTFVQRSKGEVGIAKSGYVESQCGWFSDRSVCYLASGRPVVAQDTGFSRYLPVGEGLLAFTTIDEAVGAMQSVEGDYDRHRRRARDLANEYFRADRVLTRLLEMVTTAS